MNLIHLLLPESVLKSGDFLNHIPTHVFSIFFKIFKHLRQRDDLINSSRFASVSNVSFTDYDLDFGDIGGTVTWDKPLEEQKASPALASLGFQLKWLTKHRCQVEIQRVCSFFGSCLFLFEINEQNHSQILASTLSVVPCFFSRCCSTWSICLIAPPVAASLTWETSPCWAVAPYWTQRHRANIGPTCRPTARYNGWVASYVRFFRIWVPTFDFWICQQPVFFLMLARKVFSPKVKPNLVVSWSTNSQTDPKQKISAGWLFKFIAMHWKALADLYPATCLWYLWRQLEAARFTWFNMV